MAGRKCGPFSLLSALTLNGPDRLHGAACENGPLCRLLPPAYFPTNPSLSVALFPGITQTMRDGGATPDEQCTQLTMPLWYHYLSIFAPVPTWHCHGSPGRSGVALSGAPGQVLSRHMSTEVKASVKRTEEQKNHLVRRLCTPQRLRLTHLHYHLLFQSLTIFYILTDNVFPLFGSK